AMPEAAVAADLHQPLDVGRALAAEVALHREVRVDVRAQPGDLGVGEVTHLGVLIDAQLAAHLLRGRAADAVDVPEADLGPLLRREVDACDTGQFLSAPSPGAACGGDSGRSRARRRRAG